MFALGSAASFAADEPAVDQKNDETQKANTRDPETSDVPAPFAGLGFGVGVSLTLDVGKHDRVDDASIVNQVVRVNKVSNAVPRLLLETHYFFTPNGELLGFVSGMTNSVEAGGKMLELNKQHITWGHGPFVAIQAGSDDSIINAVGFGWMIGLKRNDKPESTRSFNVGLGFIVDPSVKVLGDGFKANRAPPPGESVVRYRTTAQGGVLLMTSFSF